MWQCTRIDANLLNNMESVALTNCQCTPKTKNKYINGKGAKAAWPVYCEHVDLGTCERSDCLIYLFGVLFPLLNVRISDL